MIYGISQVAIADLSPFNVYIDAAFSHNPPSKPHPAMLEAALFEAGAAHGQAVMIGDTSFDMLMARSIGVAGIGVGWGYHAAPELLASGAARVVGTAEALAAALEEALP